jgi:hypothetical protein
MVGVARCPPGSSPLRTPLSGPAAWGREAAVVLAVVVGVPLPAEPAAFAGPPARGPYWNPGLLNRFFTALGSAPGVGARSCGHRGDGGRRVARGSVRGACGSPALSLLELRPGPSSACRGSSGALSDPRRSRLRSLVPRRGGEELRPSLQRWSASHSRLRPLRLRFPRERSQLELRSCPRASISSRLAAAAPVVSSR